MSNETVTIEAVKPPKFALCVDAMYLPRAWAESKERRLIPIPESFWSVQTRLVDRAICETDRTTQQLLPYNVLVDELGRIFTYSRGKGGEEARLHAKWSIGVGGHVDGEVPGWLNLWMWMKAEAEREVKEEVGLNLPRPANFTHFIVDRDDDVGSVHIGLLSINYINSKDIAELETDVIEHGQWINYEDGVLDDRVDRLENWSQAVIAALRQGQIRL